MRYFNPCVFIFCLFCATTHAFAATVNQLESELAGLDAEIARLETEHAKKLSALQACEKSNQNFKIAGIATLAGTGIGVMGNIALHKKYNGKNDTGSGGTTFIKLTSGESVTTATTVKDESETNQNASGGGGW